MSNASQTETNNTDRLLQLTVELRQHYETLDKVVSQMNSEAPRSVEPISEQMKQIKRIESELQPLRDDHLKRFGNVTGRLKHETDLTIELVKSLMPKLANLEKASVDSMKKLFPQIQGSVRGVQMQNAYRGNQSAT